MSQRVGDEDTGFRVWYDGTASGDEAQSAIDIVAVHGIGAHPDLTWIKHVPSTSPHETDWNFRSRASGSQEDNAQQRNWLKDADMLPAVAPTSRILRYGYKSQWFGQDAILTQASSIAPKLLSSLLNFRKECPTRPLIFIAHCFGGLVVMQTINEARINAADYPGVYTSTAGLLFFGTPFRGSDGMDVNAMYQAALREYAESQMEIDSLRILRPGNEFLKYMLDTFMKSRRDGHKADIACFFESQASNVGAIVGGQQLRTFVVDETSGCLDVSAGISKCALSRNHFNMNKFGGPDEDDYLHVKYAIEKIVGKAPTLVASRVQDARFARREDQEPWKLNDSSQRLSNSVSQHFVKRSDLLAELVDHYQQAVEQAESLLAVLHGLPGSGKTQLARYFAQNVDVAPRFFEIDASSLISIATHFRKLVTRLQLEDTNIIAIMDPEETSQLLFSFLQRLRMPFLILFDNYDSSESSEHFAINRFLPKTKNSHCIITSRNRSVATIIGSPVSLCVNEMNSQEAVATFCNYARLSLIELSALAHRMVEDIASNKLAGLPLAIAQAGAYFQFRTDASKTTEERLEQYTKEFNEQQDVILIGEDVTRVHEYGRSVFTVFNMAVRAIEQKMPIAAKLLFLCGFFHHRGVAVRYFESAALRQHRLKLSEIDLDRQELGWLRRLLNLQSNGAWARRHLVSALNLLESYALIRHDHMSETFDYHPLVHHWTLAWQADSTDNELIENALISAALICELYDYFVEAEKLNVEAIRLNLHNDIQAWLQSCRKYTRLLTSQSSRLTVYTLGRIAALITEQRTTPESRAEKEVLRLRTCSLRIACTGRDFGSLYDTYALEHVVWAVGDYLGPVLEATSDLCEMLKQMYVETQDQSEHPSEFLSDIVLCSLRHLSRLSKIDDNKACSEAERLIAILDQQESTDKSSFMTQHWLFVTLLVLVWKSSDLQTRQSSLARMTQIYSSASRTWGRYHSVNLEMERTLLLCRVWHGDISAFEELQTFLTELKDTDTNETPAQRVYLMQVLALTFFRLPLDSLPDFMIVLEARLDQCRRSLGSGHEDTIEAELKLANHLLTRQTTELSFLRFGDDRWPDGDEFDFQVLELVLVYSALERHERISSLWDEAIMYGSHLDRGYEVIDQCAQALHSVARNLTTQNKTARAGLLKTLADGATAKRNQNRMTKVAAITSYKNVWDFLLNMTQSNDDATAQSLQAQLLQTVTSVPRPQRKFLLYLTGKFFFVFFENHTVRDEPPLDLSTALRLETLCEATFSGTSHVTAICRGLVAACALLYSDLTVRSRAEEQLIAVSRYANLPPDLIDATLLLPLSTHSLFDVSERLSEHHETGQEIASPSEADALAHSVILDRLLLYYDARGKYTDCLNLMHNLFAVRAVVADYTQAKIAADLYKVGHWSHLTSDFSCLEVATDAFIDKASGSDPTTAQLALYSHVPNEVLGPLYNEGSHRAAIVVIQCLMQFASKVPRLAVENRLRVPAFAWALHRHARDNYRALGYTINAQHHVSLQIVIEEQMLPLLRLQNSEENQQFINVLENDRPKRRILELGMTMSSYRPLQTLSPFEVETLMEPSD